MVAGLVACMGQGCPAPSRRTTTQPTTQPAGGQNGGSTASACEEREYYNASLRFGFDPPADARGPFVSPGGGGTGRLLDQYFVLATDDNRPLYFDVTDVGLDLDAWVTQWVKERSAEARLIGAEEITTETGRRGMILAWINSTTSIPVGETQVFVERDGVIFGIHGWVFSDDTEELSTAIRKTFLSLCVE
ncbi:MAG TPA: hypothetical protein PKG54_03390 [Phycisphaerae bacterium]|nr:hypothetical protein [Phycisphaerae bacterium]HPU31916.1 hypothetical protein [Phycisphaerae bacterium]HQA43293.1 hypothetical protein [Phycisphaerae bacterium]HQE43827.1 hypothetical protein [Phycisphaerae bacterium]